MPAVPGVSFAPALTGHRVHSAHLLRGTLRLFPNSLRYPLTCDTPSTSLFTPRSGGLSRQRAEHS